MTWAFGIFGSYKTRHTRRADDPQCLEDVTDLVGSRTCARPRWFFAHAPQWGAADAEVKVPSDKNTELKGSPFQAWSRSVYSYVCYAYCRWMQDTVLGARGI